MNPKAIKETLHSRRRSRNGVLRMGINGALPPLPNAGIHITIHKEVGSVIFSLR